VAGSYESINYALRPAKAIERKMLCECFRRLTEFGALESFRYVGFGSTYFSDFALVHRALGIQQMVSIEKDIENRQRFQFNRPYRCIEMKYGHSNTVLSTLNWNIPTIGWFDYDDRLDAGILADVQYVTMSASPVSLFAFTVNAHPYDYSETNPRLPQLTELVGEGKVPNGTAEKDLSGWGTAAVSRRIMTNEIRETLNARNGALPTANQILYKQLFYFRYADGAKMLTVGGLLYERRQANLVAKCDFESLSFVQTNSRANCAPYSIEVPSLTYREIRHLDGQLPRIRRSRLRSPRVPRKDLQRYEALYRHFPHFGELVI
jgi:hypothetical protein